MYRVEFNIYYGLLLVLISTTSSYTPLRYSLEIFHVKACQEW